jgi:6-pyruvoyl-tetrahydropterin synthase
LENNNSIKIHKISSHFSASHTVLTENLVEGIHGHNYYVEVELYGKLDKENMLFNFCSLDEILKNLISEWDHYTLLPRHNNNIQLTEKGANIEISYGDRFYSLPRQEVKILDCKNITTEILGNLLAQKIQSFLSQEEKSDNITKIKAVIWETPQYAASHTIHLQDS